MIVVVVDDENRENEGDLTMAAQLATPEAMAFLVKHGTGIVCVSMKEEDLERLQLPLMVSHKENEEKLCTAFTVTLWWLLTGLGSIILMTFWCFRRENESRTWRWRLTREMMRLRKGSWCSTMIKSSFEATSKSAARMHTISCISGICHSFFMLLDRYNL